MFGMALVLVHFLIKIDNGTIYFITKIAERSFPYPTQFEIINELDETVFYVKFGIGIIETRHGPHGYIQSVHIIERHGDEVIRGIQNVGPLYLYKVS